MRNTIPIPHSATTLPLLCHTLAYSSILCHYSTWLHETDGCDFHIGMCSMHIVASNIGVVAVYLTSPAPVVQCIPEVRQSTSPS